MGKGNKNFLVVLHFYGPHRLQYKWCGHARILVTSKDCNFTVFEMMGPQLRLLLGLWGCHDQVVMASG